MRVIRMAWIATRLTVLGLMLGTGSFIALLLFVGLFVHMLFHIVQGNSYDGTMANIVLFGAILPIFEAAAVWLVFKSGWRECLEGK